MLAVFPSLFPDLPGISWLCIFVASICIVILINIIILKVVVTIITNTVLDVMEKRGYKRWP